MKGKAIAAPTNHVEWANGFKSNMPDWITARRCAAVDQLLWFAKEARSVLLVMERPGAFQDEYDQKKHKTALEGLQAAIGWAEAGIIPPVEFAPPEPVEAVKAFPKPPGVS